MKTDTPTEVHVQTVVGRPRETGGLASDEAALAGLGYKQEFKRAFHPIEVFGLGFSIIGLFPSIA